MSNLKEVFRDLEKKTLDSLRSAVLNSKIESRHMSSPSIDVNVFDYTELVIVDDELTFLDAYGQHYSLYNGDCDLEDLIDILSQHNIRKEGLGKLWQKQIELQEEMQSKGLNIVTCNSCETLIIHETDTSDLITCHGCGKDMSKSDCVDYYYEGMPFR